MALTKHSVYKITSPNGKVYIGCSSCVEKRWLHHIYNDAFSADIKKYGWSAFAKEVLAKCETKAQAEEIEAQEIARHNSTDPSIGYNIASFKGRGKVAGFFSGKNLSDEHRQKIAESKHKPVICVETQKVYRSVKEAEEATGISHSCISRVCRGERKKTANLHWKFVEVVV